MDGYLAAAILTVSASVLMGAARGIWAVYKYSDRKKARKTHSLLMAHPVFARLVELEIKLQNSFTYPDKKLEALMREAMLQKVRVHQKLLLAYAKEADEDETCTLDNCECNPALAYSQHVNMYNDGVRRSVNWESEDYFTAEGIPYDEESKETMNDFLKDLRRWESHKEKTVQDAIKAHARSLFYGSCKRKNMAIYDIYELVQFSLHDDMEKCLDSLGDKYDDRRFLGIEKEGQK